MNEDLFSPTSSKLEDMLDWVLIWTGIVLIFLGSVGMIIVLLGYNIIRDRVLNFVFTFISFYMLFWGFVLILYHKKIVVREK